MATDRSTQDTMDWWFTPCLDLLPNESRLQSSREGGRSAWIWEGNTFRELQQCSPFQPAPGKQAAKRFPVHPHCSQQEQLPVPGV